MLPSIARAVSETDGDVPYIYIQKSQIAFLGAFIYVHVHRCVCAYRFGRTESGESRIQYTEKIYVNHKHVYVDQQQVHVHPNRFT